MVFVVLELVVKPECVDELREMLKAALPDTRSYDGCHGVTGFVNEDGRTMLFTERWTSKSHYVQYLAWRTENGTLEQVIGLCAGPPSIRYFDQVDV